MKITGKKDMTAERLRGRTEVDKFWLDRINAVMGPKFAIWQVKATNPDTFTDPEIVIRFNETLASLVELEYRRQDWQSRVDNAKNAAEIDVIIEGLFDVE